MAEASSLSRPGRWLRTALAVWVIYGNLAILNSQYAKRFDWLPRFPVVELFVDVFYLFGMFHSFNPEARELAVQGLPLDAPEDGEWVRLEPDEFFIGERGRQESYAVAYRQVGSLIPERIIRTERARVLRRVRTRHNRLHPDNPMKKVRIGGYSWPKSPDGWEAGRVVGQEQLSIWYTE